MWVAVDGGGLDSAATGAVSVNQRRGVDRNSQKGKGSLQDNWSEESWSESGWAGKVDVEDAGRSALRETLVNVESHQALRMCKDREVDPSEVSCVSSDRVHDLWPS